MGDITVQGRKIHYISPQGAEGSGKKGQTVLLVHGATDNHKIWSSQYEYLQKEHTPFALDLPGRGGSEGPGIDNDVDYREFIKAFADAMGIAPFVFCGHSMGGSMSLDYALHYPSDLTGFIIVGSSPHWEIPQEAVDRWRNNREEAMKQDFDAMFSKETPAHIREPMRQELAKTSTEVCVSDLEACRTYHLDKDLHRINVPALIVCGDEDYDSLEGTRLAHAKLPKSTLEMISAAGHPVMAEQPERVNAAIDTFLRTL